MTSMNNDYIQPSSSERYADEAQQVLLRALDGAGGSWVRHEPKANLADLIRGTANDNKRGE